MTKSFIETHGQDETKTEPTLLEQVWGQFDASRYGTLDESEYLNRINNMTRADLEMHARQMGVVVVENSLRLRDKLMTEFRSFVALTRRPPQPKSNVHVSDEAAKVLKEGR